MLGFFYIATNNLFSKNKKQQFFKKKKKAMKWHGILFSVLCTASADSRDGSWSMRKQVRWAAWAGCRAKETLMEVHHNRTQIF
jgi:hypothetical protein